MKTATKVFLILTAVFSGLAVFILLAYSLILLANSAEDTTLATLGYVYLGLAICGVVVVVVASVSLRQLEQVESASELTGLAVTLIVFVVVGGVLPLVSGILMLCMKDSDL